GPDEQRVVTLAARQHRTESVELAVPADERIADETEKTTAESVDELLCLRGEVGNETAREGRSQLADPQPERRQDTSCPEAWIAGDAEEQGLQAEAGHVCARRLLPCGGERGHKRRRGVVETDRGKRDTLAGSHRGWVRRLARGADTRQRLGDLLRRGRAGLEE